MYTYRKKNEKKLIDTLKMPNINDFETLSVSNKQKSIVLLSRVRVISFRKNKKYSDIVTVYQKRCGFFAGL